MKQKNLQTTTVTLALLAATFGICANADAQMAVTTQAITVQPIMAQNVQLDTSAAPSVIWPNIKAESAFVYNPLTNNVLYSKNPDEPRATASLLKIMTADTVNKILNAAPYLANKPIKILNTKVENTADAMLKADTTWLPADLVQYMLIGSSNRAAESLASGIIPRSSFISLMNYHAKNMGLKKTYFTGPSGLNGEGTSTAREIAQMFWQAIEQNPGLLDITRKESAVFNMGAGIDVNSPIFTNPNTLSITDLTKSTLIVSNTNKIISTLPIVFGKTGFTDTAGGNLAIVTQMNERANPYVTVVMGSTVDDRFTDVSALASTTSQLEILFKALITASKSSTTPSITLK